MNRRTRFGGFKLGAENVLLRRFAPYLLYGLITLLVVVLSLDNHRWLATVELAIQDMMVTLGRRPEPPSQVILVNVDDDAVAKLGQWPWNSERVGYLVGMLNEYKPKAIGLDLELPESFDEDTAGNQFLAEMIARAGNVVLPMRFTLAESDRLSPAAPDRIAKSALIVVDEAGRMLSLPYPTAGAVSAPYAEVCQAAWGLGQINTWQDVDSRIRRDPLVVNYEGIYYPSMALQLVRLATDAPRTQVRIDPGRGVDVGALHVPTDEAGMFRIDYRGPAGTIPSMSAAKVLEGLADGHAITGKIVVVGVTASGYGTALRTSSSSTMPRAEKIATVAANMLDGRYITPVNMSQFLDLLILAAIGGFCAMVLPRVGLTYRLVILFVLGFALLNLNFILYTSFKLVTKTLYPTLEVVAFLIFAPFVKPIETILQPKQRARTKPRARHAKLTDEADKPKPVSTPAATDAVPVRHVREGAPAGVISGLSETVVLDVSGQTATASSGKVKIDRPIELTPTFEPLSSDVGDGTAVQPRDVMNVSPSPMGLDKEADSPVTTGAAAPGVTDLQRLGRYEILGMLGEGAMGTVYKGKNPAIGRMVALKTIRAGAGFNPHQARELRERLVREAKAAGKLSHPNIVTIYDVGTEGDLDYIAMEYLEGYTLEQVVRKKVQLNFRILAKMLTQVCDALEYAHKAGIVHRDIKPANIMVLDDFKVKVTDFGIARFESSSMSMTQTGVAVGTPYYISPEQLRGGTVDRRCDIFSLGVVAYELLTHKRPFSGDNISQLIFAITQTNPEPPSKIDPNIPGLLDVVISKALAKDPRERYQTADEMAHDLAVFVEDLAGAKAFRV
ncbi:MAG: serine/threonine-protein kinase [Candidatus Zixiibacteriota bacterium]